MSKFGIDVSKWQGDFNFAVAKKNEGVQFAILKIGGGDSGLYKDSKFEANYKKCEACGLDKGAYFFGQALTMEQAKEEAKFLISLLKDHRFEYPIFYDVEAKMLSLGKRELTDIIKYVCSTVEEAGYWTGIYASHSTFESEVFDEDLKKYSHWAASWAVKETPKLSKGGETQMWQFGGETNSIRTNRINGQVVDQNYCYVDYPAKIKEKGINGYEKVIDPKPEDKPEIPKSELEVGNKIKIKNGAVDINNGKTFAGFVYKNEYDVIKIDNGAVVFGIGKEVTGKVKATDAIKVSASTSETSNQFKPYMVRVAINNLRIRKGPGINYGVNGYTGIGSFTIVEEAKGEGSTKGWGKLKSGAGWISLDYATRV